MKIDFGSCRPILSIQDTIRATKALEPQRLEAVLDSFLISQAEREASLKFEVEDEVGLFIRGYNRGKQILEEVMRLYR